VLDVQSDRGGAFDGSDLKVLETLAGQIAGAMETARLYQAERAAHQQVGKLATYLQNAREEERTHIAREILDEFGQLMTALQMDLSWLVRRLPDSEPPLAEKVAGMSDVIDKSLQVVRRLSGQLRPSVLDHFGLAAAIRWEAETFSEQNDIPYQLHLDGAATPLDRELSTALFRILQESLSNVARHAEATEVQIDLHVDAGQATLAVVDDGRGIAPEEMSGPRSMGLAGMRQRAQALGGQVIIEALPGRGTSVTASIPRRRPESGA
jgi:signal transduction histidine kinase